MYSCNQIVNIWDLFLAITPYKWVLILGGKSTFKPDFMMAEHLAEN